MKKKILIICFAVLGLIVLSGCSSNSTIQSYCVKQGYDNANWINALGPNRAFYCEQTKREVINHGDYFNIVECGKKRCNNKSIEQQLGNAICEERYDMVYEGYEDGILKCKPEPEMEEYDGIKIEVGKK